uniref:Essential protein Yae1 N-terminal domain-containing protein n=1 Tax=Pavo cristatus TaxID=9049 RepID=A0A8C9F168_PAVCR
MASPSPDMFDEIVMAEDRFHGEGYQEGYAEGSHAGAAEGRRCGALYGAKIGSEIGSYLGFALTWQCLLPKCTDEKNSFFKLRCPVWPPFPFKKEDTEKQKGEQVVSGMALQSGPSDAEKRIRELGFVSLKKRRWRCPLVLHEGQF